MQGNLSLFHDCFSFSDFRDYSQFHWSFWFWLSKFLGLKFDSFPMFDSCPAISNPPGFPFQDPNYPNWVPEIFRLLWRGFQRRKHRSWLQPLSDQWLARYVGRKNEQALASVIGKQRTNGDFTVIKLAYDISYNQWWSICVWPPWVYRNYMGKYWNYKHICCTYHVICHPLAVCFTSLWYRWPIEFANNVGHDQRSLWISLSQWIAYSSIWIYIYRETI